MKYRWRDAHGFGGKMYWLWLWVNGLTRLAVVFACCGMLSGCLWICRVPFPMEARYSDDGVCTNRTWVSMITDERNRHMNDPTNAWWCAGYYPTIKMRCVVTMEMCKPIDAELKGEDLYHAKWRKRFGWFPLTVLWLTSPIDAVVDTLMIPYDMTVL